MPPKYVPGSGSLGAKLLVLADAPTYEESMAEKGYIGPFGREFDKICSESGINRGDLWLTHVSKYEVMPNPKGKKIPFAVRAKNSNVDLEEQLNDLRNEIAAVNPNCILALGSAGLWALTGKFNIGDFRGSILSGWGRKIVPSYNPRDLIFNENGAEFKGYWNRQLMVHDFKRALAQSNYEEFRLPIRQLQVAKSSYELYEFIQRNKDNKRMSVDIEAGGSCLPICIGFSCSPSHGLTVPLWNSDGISNIPDSDLVNLWSLTSDLLYEKDIIGQNFNYDRDKIKRLGFVIRRLASDVMLKSHAILPEFPKRLALNQSMWTEEPFYKDEGMYEGSLNDLFIGCARDACVTLEIDQKMESALDELNQRKFFENFLMELPDLYWSIEQLGMMISHDRRDELLHKYIKRDEEIRFELYNLCGEIINTNSPKQVKELLFTKLKLPERDGTGEEEITSLLNLQSVTNKNTRKILELILEDRRVRRTVSSEIGVLPDFDGRVRTTYYMCLETGRTSTGQQDPPIRPSLEIEGEDGKKKKKSLGRPFQTMTKHGDIGQDIRSMYIPDEGEIFIQADSSQAEARVVWLLANDEEALRLVDEIDYHALTASWFFGGSESDYSKKVLGYESPIRFAGKTLRHAGHLGAGKRRAAISVNTDARKYKIDITINENIAERALKIFHQKQPSIQSVFHSGIIECLRRDRTLIAPVPYGFDVDEGGKRVFFERWGDELFRQAFSYIPQRAVSDNTKGAGIRIRRIIPEIKIVMESHDALLFSVPFDKRIEYASVIKMEFERPISFKNCSIQRRNLIIPCELEEGMNYQDFKKFRLNEVIVQ